MRYIAQLRGHDSDGWQDALYTDDPARAARVVAVASDPKVKDGRVVDTQEQTQRRQER